MTWHSDMPTEYRDAIVTGDARELLPRVPSASVALAFADPPYWVGFDYGHAKDDELDYIDPTWLVTELARVARVVCVTPGIANMWSYPRPDWVLGWFKFGGTGRNAYGGFNAWEPVLVYGKPPRQLWQDAIDVPTYRNHFNVNGSYKIIKKACPKPEPLLQWLIDGITQPGDAVIDPTSGLGTTATVAKKAGRHYVGFEIDPDTAERARQRVRDTQPPLLIVDPEQLPLAV